MSDANTPPAAETQPPTTEPAFGAGQTPAQPTAEAALIGTDPLNAGARAEEARVSTDSAGFARSGEVVPTTVPLDVLGRPVVGAVNRLAPIGLEVPGRAETRVLASGLEIPAHLRADRSDDQRLFTAATRTLRNRVLYEVDAPIPLTRAEFKLKQRSKAVRELEFEDGVVLRPLGPFGELIPSAE